MTKAQIRRSDCITRRTGQKGAHSAEVLSLASVSEKSAIKTELKSKLLKCKNCTAISSFNVRTLNPINQLPELTAAAAVAAAAEQNIDILCVQEHHFYYSELELKYHDAGNGWTFESASAWKNFINAVIGGVGILLSPRALSPLNSIESVQSRIIIATFNGNPHTTVISCYSPTSLHAIR